MNPRKKLLFISYSHPPIQTAGSIRSANIVRYLSELGWEVHLLTPDPQLFGFKPDSGYAPAQEDFIPHYVSTLNRRSFPSFLLESRQGTKGTIERAFRKVARLRSLNWEDDWETKAVKTAEEQIPVAPDLILATGNPWSNFRIAEKLAHHYSTPFVLDYRDPWTISPIWKARFSEEQLSIDAGIEARILKKAASVILNTRLLMEAMDARFQLGDKCSWVPNGFDPIEMQNSEIIRHEPFSIIYTGIFYNKFRPAHQVTRFLKKFKQKYPESASRVKFHYYGKTAPELLRSASEMGVSNMVVNHGQVGRKAALAAQSGADLVFVDSYASDIPGTLMLVPCKMYDAMGLGKRMLLVAPKTGEISRIAKETGYCPVFNYEELDQMTDYLNEIMLNKTSFRPPIERFDYSWERLSRNLDAILKSHLPVEAELSKVLEEVEY